MLHVISDRLRIGAARWPLFWTLLVWTTIGFGPNCTVRAESLKVGAARRIITPNPLLPITGGMGPTKPPRGKRGELSVRALVIADANTTIAIVSVDSLGFPSVLADRARRKIQNINPENVLIGATHTHSAPDTYAFPDGKGGHSGDLDYMQTVCDRIAEAVNEAYAQQVPVTMKVASGEAQGKIAYNYYAPDLYDRRVSVLQFQAINTNEVVATLVNYAIHPEVLGADEGYVSPDLIGPLYDRIEEKVGGTAIFMNGAQGGMVTADNRILDQPSDAQRGYWRDERSWEECLRIGNLLADESLRIVESAAKQDDVQLVSKSRMVRFPVESDEMWGVVKYSPLKYPHQDDRSISSRINYVTLGNASLLTIPGEALPNIGFYLKRKMSGEHQFLFGLTNDAFGYIMTRVDFASFPRYDYISRVSLGEETGEILIKNALEMFEGQ